MWKIFDSYSWNWLTRMFSQCDSNFKCLYTMNFNHFSFMFSFSHVWLCDLMDCSPPGSSVHEISQVRTLEWVAMPFSRWSSWPRDGSQVSPIAGRFFTVWATVGKFFTTESPGEAVEVLFRRVCLLLMEVRTLYSIILLATFNSLNWSSFIYIIGLMLGAWDWVFVTS